MESSSTPSGYSPVQGTDAEPLRFPPFIGHLPGYQEEDTSEVGVLNIRIIGFGKNG